MTPTEQFHRGRGGGGGRQTSQSPSPLDYPHANANSNAQHHNYYNNNNNNNNHNNNNNSGSGTATAGFCMMSNKWKDDQHPSLINFISQCLSARSFRLNIVPIAPDFIFNCGGASVAFIFITTWDSNNASLIYNRVHKLMEQFAHLYVILVLPTKEQNDSFVSSYFKSGFHVGRPPFVPALSLEMGFEAVLKIAHARGVCKQHDIVTRIKAEREQAVQGMDAFLRVVTSIPNIDNHDANSLNQAIGSIEAIAKASKEYVLQNTDLSADKAERIENFFRNPKFHLRVKFS